MSKMRPNKSKLFPFPKQGSVEGERLNMAVEWWLITGITKSADHADSPEDRSPKTCKDPISRVSPFHLI